MPLFRVSDNSSLVPFRRVQPGPDLYEREIEDLLWANLEEFTGVALFPVARQPHIAGGGIPDIIALDQSARVVVIEVKRDIDRAQLAQCLEYAGWARRTNLDELASIYHGGQARFFEDWQVFTELDTLSVVNRSPRIVLVAREVHDRTQAALDFLTDNNLPVQMITATIYEDENGRRIVDVSGDHEPAPAGPPGTPGGTTDRWQAIFRGRRFVMADLLEHGVLEPGEQLEWRRPRLGVIYTATLLADGTIQLPDGSVWGSPSLAAGKCAGLTAFAGWTAWRVPRLNDALLDDLRHQLLASDAAGDDV